MARKKNAAPQHVEPEEESRDVEEPGAGGLDDASEGGSSISKSEAARRALDAGMEKPEEATDFIRKQFGIEMGRQHFSAVKSQLRKKQAGGAAAPGARPGRKPRAEGGILSPPAKLTPPGEQPDLLAAMEAMKPLVDALGAEKVKRIADLLG